MWMNCSYLFIAVVGQILELQRSAAVKFPLSFSHFLGDVNTGIIHTLLTQVVAGRDRAVGGVRRVGPRTPGRGGPLVGDHRVNDVASPVVVADAGGNSNGYDHILGWVARGTPGPRGPVTGGHESFHFVRLFFFKKK